MRTPTFVAYAVVLLLGLPCLNCQQVVAQQDVAQELDGHQGGKTKLQLESKTNELRATYRAAAESKWQADIDSLCKNLSSRESSSDSILLIGSSSIRLWETAERDLAPWSITRLGYGGARFSDLIVFVDRLIGDRDCQAIVIFVANDIQGKPDDKEPAAVLELLEGVLDIAQTLRPEADVFLLPVTPTPSRFSVWSQIKLVNQGMKSIADSNKRIRFVDVADAFLAVDGKPRQEFFVDDQLHLNERGYGIWSNALKDAFQSAGLNAKSDG